MSSLDDAKRKYESAVDARINAAKKTDVPESAAGAALAKYNDALRKELKAREEYNRALEAAGKPRLPVLLRPKKSKRVL